MNKKYRITEAVRGEYRHQGQVVRYDFDRGPAPKMPQQLLDRLTQRGLVAEVQTKSRKKG